MLSNGKIRKLIIKIQKIKYKLNKKKVLTRCACLGNDVVKEVLSGHSILNIQKGRVDLINNFKTPRKENYAGIINILEKKYIYPLILQQLEIIFFLQDKPRYIILDTYSELVDRKYQYKNNIFHAYKSDIKKGKNNCVDEFGLLDLEEIYKEYKKFIENCEERYANVPIIFIEFPTKLDTREKYKKRGEKIKETLYKLSNFYSNVYFLDIDDSKIIAGENENEIFDGFSFHPYHFSDQTKKEIANKLKNIIAEIEN